ncbi:unnamed protein product, partial [Hymenolepis diminuta]
SWNPHNKYNKCSIGTGRNNQNYFCNRYTDTTNNRSWADYSKKSPEDERDLSCPTKPLNTSHVEKSNIPDPECIKEECPDFLVLDYFQSARKGYSWQPFEEVTIKPSDICSVRSHLEGLRDLPDADICDALRFVYSEHQYLPTFFDRPPPECRMNALYDWHYFYAARALALRQVYAFAPQMTFDQCLKALSSSDWNFNNAISKILF